MHFRAVAHNPNIFQSEFISSHRFSLPTFCDGMRPRFRGRRSDVTQILNHDRYTQTRGANFYYIRIRLRENASRLLSRRQHALQLRLNSWTTRAAGQLVESKRGGRKKESRRRRRYKRTNRYKYIRFITLALGETP